MQLRKATLDDLEILEYWDTKQHVKTALGEYDAFNWEKELPYDVEWKELLIAQEGDYPIGFIQIIDPELEETHYWEKVESNLRAIDIWIGEEHDLGKGFGTKMMQHAISKCFSNDAVIGILVDPRVNNSRACYFYEHLGFKQIERRMFGKDECFVYRLDRESWENECQLMAESGHNLS